MIDKIHDDLELGGVYHGFTVEEISPLPELRAIAYRFSHRQSGARLLHLRTDDPESLFAIAFLTPPPDDTGLPHILEHTVLCGSRRYPVKDAFVELLKRSLATFLNAFTYPDKTVYPCASMNEKDFLNIVRVYCDAVFQPLLTEVHFKQEGHHHAFAKAGDLASPLIIRGVVYNEMKGAYSDLDGVIDRHVPRAVFPESVYGRDAGGDPLAIPGLTYEQFRQFHRVHYHPSNAWLFLYGRPDWRRILALLHEEYLASQERLTLSPSLTPQPRWPEPRCVTVPFPIAPHEKAEGKSAVVLCFLVGELADPVDHLALHLLDDYLLGNAAAPLRKALIDSRLGEELSDSGYASHQRETFFTVGLKGTMPERSEAIRDLIISTCQRLASAGLEPRKIEASLHLLEIASRQITSHYPLNLMDRVYRSWLYGGDPLLYLRLDQHLHQLRARCAAGRGYLENLLQRHLAANPHYAMLTFVPDPGWGEQREKETARRLAEYKASLAPAALERIRREADEIEAKQSSPNSPEALATLPRLALADVPKDGYELPTQQLEVAGRPLLWTDLFSNGITYINLAFDLSDLPDELVDYLPLYAEAMTNMGAAGENYAAMAEREAECCAGIRAASSINGQVYAPERLSLQLVATAHGLDRNLPRMLAVLGDRLLRNDLSDLERLADVAKQGRVHRRSSIVAAGSHYAALRAGRALSPHGAAVERLSGLSQIALFDRFADDENFLRNEAVDKLRQIQRHLHSSPRVCASVVGAESSLNTVKNWLEGCLPPGCQATPSSHLAAKLAPPSSGKMTAEGVVVPADVAFVAAAFSCPPLCHPDAPALHVLSICLCLDYLFGEIRIKGGAYGANASFSGIPGLFSLSSYRDPHIRRTLDIFRKLRDYLERDLNLSAEGVEQAIISAIKTIDRPIRPSQAVDLALMRFLIGETPEFRREYRRRLLALAAADLRRASQHLIAGVANAAVCALASREHFESEERSSGGLGLMLVSPGDCQKERLAR